MFKMNFKEMRMKKKLLTAFVVLIILASISGVVSTGLLIAMNVKSNNALNDYGFAQGSIGRAMVMITDSRREVRDIVNFQKPENVANAKEQLAETKEKYKSFVAEIEPTIKTKLAKEYWAAIQSAVTEYQAVQESVLSEAESADTAEERVVLNERMLREFDPAYEKLYSAYADLMYGKVDAGKDVQQSIIVMAIISCLICVGLILFAMITGVKFGNTIADGIAIPLSQCKDRFKAMVEGDFQSPIPVVDTQDEVKEMTDEMGVFLRTTSAIISDLNRGMGEMANGNFNIVPEVEYPGDFEGIKMALAGFIIKISDALQQINNASQEVAGSSSQIAQSAQALAEGATDQSSSIEELQATVSTLSDEVDKNALSSKEANDMAKNVENGIMESNDQMQQMVDAMDIINESSQQISNIINTINDIASQTNLLALNASIEAARAGEMGKGFAVVANEVGNLASQSAEAAKNSTELIDHAIKAVENGKYIADMTAEKLNVSASRTQELAATIEGITEASVRQAESLDQVSEATEQIASVIEENTAMSEESSASSEEMAHQATILEELVAQFKLKEGSF